jgi:hypothetical protein
VAVTIAGSSNLFTHILETAVIKFLEQGTDAWHTGSIDSISVYSVRFQIELLGLFWTLSIVLYVEDKKSHNVSET